MARRRRETGRGLLAGILVTIVFVAVGVWLLHRSFIRYQESQARAVGKTAVQGMIIRFERRGSTANGSRKLTLPVVQFVTLDGRQFEFVGAKESGARAYYLNDKVRVLYDPKHPSQAEIDRWSEIWLGVTVTAVAGSLLVVFPPVAVLQYLVARSKRPRGGALLLTVI